MNIAELETPALLIDLNIMEANLTRVAEYAAGHNLRLRPHTKTHKMPALGRRQLDSGAAGLTVAKTTEAEVMLRAQPKDLLIAYPVMGVQKLERLMAVARQTDVTVSVDSIAAAEGISAAASAHGQTIGILTEFDAGLHRVGVRPGEELVRLVRAVESLPGLDFRGITFYPGHIKDMANSDSEAQLAEVDRILTATVELIEGSGIAVPLVSGGSTPTLFSSHKVSRLTEIRPGTYIFNDRNVWQSGACRLEDCAASILTTVVSTSVEGQAIIDGGSKTFSSDRMAVADAVGFGYVTSDADAVFTKMNEEHGYVDLSRSGKTWKTGDRVRVIPNHICVAVNLHEQAYGIRGDRVEEVWKVEGRGKLQ